MTERVKRVATDAEQAFWAEVAGRFPEAAQGDFDPLAAARFSAACEAAVQHWVDLNVPDPFEELRDKLESIAGSADGRSRERAREALAILERLRS